MIHAVAAAVVVTPIVVLARKRVHWRSWELLRLVFPFCVRVAFILFDMTTGSKSLSNLMVEPGILALGLALGALARVAMSKCLSESTAATLALVGMCAVAAGIFWIVPALPE